MGIHMKTDPEWLTKVLREDIKKLLMTKIGPQWDFTLSFLSITTYPDNDIIGFKAPDNRHVRIVIESKAALEEWNNCWTLDNSANIASKREMWDERNLLRVRLLRVIYVALSNATDLISKDEPWRVYQITVDNRGHLTPGLSRG